MQETKDIPTNKDQAVAVQPPQKVNHTATIKSQLLAKIGRPPGWHRVEISEHYNGKYRVNIWEQSEPKTNISVTPGPRIGVSYYLTVSDKGEIVHSDPPLTKVGAFN